MYILHVTEILYRIGVAALLAALCPLPAVAGEPGAARPFSESLTVRSFFDPSRLLTTGGVRFSGSNHFTLEPEIGVSHRATERDLPGALAESVHELHAQAGCRLSLPRTLYLSAAAKVPVFTYESTSRSIGQDAALQRSYDFGRPFKTGLSWTGELGIHLFSSIDLTFYYDQCLSDRAFPGIIQQEDRIGTRIILRFK